MVGPQEHVTIATWRHPFHRQWRPSNQSDDASGPNPPPLHVSGQLQGAPHLSVREVDTKADSAESVDSHLVKVALLGRTFTDCARKYSCNVQEYEWPKRNCVATQFCVAPHDLSELWAAPLCGGPTRKCLAQW